MNLENMQALVKRLRKLKKFKKKRGRFNMEHFGSRWYGSIGALKDEKPVCRTQACLAGEAILEFGAGVIAKGGGIDLVGEHRDSPMPIVAQSLLDLDNDQATRLFYFRSWGYENGWPREFEIRYRAAKTATGRLNVAIARVKHFIKTDGEE
jgi:hypothetical protein